MSSTSSLSLTMAETSTPSQSSSSNLDDPSTLLFVFLISVLSLFSAFLSCGIIWHRLVARRRRMIDPLLQVGPPPVIKPLEQPEMWDLRVFPTHEVPRLIDTKPLAGDRCGETGSQSVQEPPKWRQRLTRWISSEILYLFRRPSVPQLRSETAQAVQAKWLQDGSDIRVSVFIQMPYSPLRTEEHRADYMGFHEVVIGSMDLTYRDLDPS